MKHRLLVSFLSKRTKNFANTAIRPRFVSEKPSGRPQKEQTGQIKKYTNMPLNAINNILSVLGSVGNAFGLSKLRTSSSIFVEQFYNPFVKYADCAYSGKSAEELKEWTLAQISEYATQASVHLTESPVKGELEIISEEEFDISIDDSHDNNINKISQYVHKHLDASFSVDKMKYLLQRFILPGIINAIIDRKFELVESWFEPSAAEFVRNFTLQQVDKRVPVVYHIAEVSDPVGARHNNEYRLLFTFSLIYSFQFPNSRRSPILDKRIGLEMRADRTDYPDSILSWKIVQPGHLLYLLNDPEAQDI